MRFSELENVRIKLDEKGSKEFWKIVDEFGGVQEFSSSFEISSSKMYNWKSKDCFIPIELVRMAFGNEGSHHVEALKGPGRSKPIKDIEFPINQDNELLTRISCSVNVNKNGIPLYQTSDIGLLNRFAELLCQIGETPYKIYERDIYELRYPKYLHKILTQIDYSEDFDALIDEKAKIDDKIILEDKEIKPEKINQLYHRGKRLKLALMKEDNMEVAKMMSEEREKIKSFLD